MKDALTALAEENDIPRPTLYRNPKHLTPTDGVQRVNLPKDFFKLSVDEIKSMSTDQQAKNRQNEILMTSQMRENAALKEKRVYSFCLIRTRLPDSSVLEVHSK